MDSNNVSKFLKEVEGKSVDELIAAGREKLASMPAGGGGGGGGGGAPAGGGGGDAAPAAEEKKVEEESEDEVRAHTHASHRDPTGWRAEYFSVCHLSHRSQYAAPLLRCRARRGGLRKRLASCQLQYLPLG